MLRRDMAFVNIDGVGDGGMEKEMEWGTWSDIINLKSFMTGEVVSHLFALTLPLDTIE